ncbi:MAG: VirB4 family type IV secretion system protein [Thermoprotei archaeon]|jgi:type IV secretory pathway VirB4 component
MYYYELFPVNFITLSNEKQLELINRYHQFLNSLSSEIKILVVKSIKNITISEAQYQVFYNRFFIISDEPIDDMLKSFGLIYERVAEIHQDNIVKTTKDMVIGEDGKLMKAMTIYALPSEIIDGFITETYGAVEKILMRIKPIPQDIASNKINRYAKIVRGTLLVDQQKGRTPDIAKVIKQQMIDETVRSVVSGQTKLFEFTCNLIVSGNNIDELKENTKLVKSILASRLIKVDIPKFVQYQMINGEIGKKLIMDTITVGAFFPFISADIIETPNGIFLGINSITGAPVIYDPSLRSNYNISILGVTGSGKSYAGKIILKRIIEKDPKTPYFVIDPENEFKKLGEELGGKIITFTQDEPLGLDPLTILPPVEAADFIIHITQLPTQLQPTFRTIIHKSKTLKEAYDKSPQTIREFLESIINGPESFAFTGKPMEFTPQMILGLKHIESETMKQIISLLVFGKIWKMLNDEHSSPTHQRKIVIVDEAWLFMQIPSAAKFLERVSRLGRKRNILFLIMSQRPADVLGESKDKPGPGRTIIENSATKIILRQSETTADIVAQAFNLSEKEKDTITEFQPGEGILISENVHVQLRFMASEEEHKLFTTKPTELM